MASKLKINRGTTFAITLNYLQNGAPASLVGATVRFTVKTSEYDADDTDAAALILKNITSHTNPTGGVTTIGLVPTDTQNIVPGTYFYDIKIEDASNNIYKLDEGSFVVSGSPTNRIV